MLAWQTWLRLLSVRFEASNKASNVSYLIPSLLKGWVL